jgi:sulfofructosephosphate aldolase
MSLPDRPTRLGALARPSGAFAMLALDQREGLRTMMAAQPGRPSRDVPDGELTAFKIEAARVLTPLASAVLLDVQFALAAVRAADAVAPRCGLIVAADALVQERGGAVEWTEVDEDVLGDESIHEMADAYKLLVIWRRGEEAERARVVGRFVAACRALDRPAIVEGIVRSADGSPLAAEAHAELVVEAARELAGFGASLYKGEVPMLGAAEDEATTEAAARVTAAIDVPWVVLSNGTPADRFGSAMLAACRGGASGFLAGRAIWTASLAAPDVTAHLATVAAPRLAALAAAVDEAVTNRRTAS